MADPTTSNILLSVPTRGSNSGIWDVPVNNDFTSIDGRLGGVQTISLTNVNVSLTKPTGTATPSGGPTQAENAIVQFSGTLSGNCVITFPLPGYYIVKNSCTVGAFYVQARALGTGNLIGLPDGRAIKIWTDGTNVDFCDTPEVGSYLDLAATTYPTWMTVCTVSPYLLCDGTTYNNSSFPILGGRLGSTFGGNGATTFGVPDLRNRYRIPVGGGAGRITSAGSGVDGATLGASGGDQQVQTHTHGITDPKHTHVLDVYDNSGSTQFVTGGGGGALTHVVKASGSASTGITISAFGSGSSGNIPPGLVAGIVLIKT